MVNASPPTVSTGHFVLGRCCFSGFVGLAVLVGLAACSQIESEEAKEVAREANAVGFAPAVRNCEAAAKKSAR